MDKFKLVEKMFDGVTDEFLSRKDISRITGIPYNRILSLSNAKIENEFLSFPKAEKRKHGATRILTYVCRTDDIKAWLLHGGEGIIECLRSEIESQKIVIRHAEDCVYEIMKIFDEYLYYSTMTIEYRMMYDFLAQKILSKFYNHKFIDLKTLQDKVKLFQEVSMEHKQLGFSPIRPTSVDS